MRTIRRLWAVGAMLLTGLHLGPACGPVIPERSALGVVVERVEAGYGGARAGLQPDDVLLGWRPSDARRAARHDLRPIRAPVDFDLLELGPGQLGPVEVAIRRGDDMVTASCRRRHGASTYGQR